MTGKGDHDWVKTAVLPPLPCPGSSPAAMLPIGHFYFFCQEAILPFRRFPPGTAPDHSFVTSSCGGSSTPALMPQKEALWNKMLVDQFLLITGYKDPVEDQQMMQAPVFIFYQTDDAAIV